MLKENAVASIGEHGLLLPARVKASLAANDRIKLYLSVIQAALQHAEHPSAEAIDLSREQASAGLKEQWIDEMVASTTRNGDVYFLPGLPTLIKALAADLAIMAKPVLESNANAALQTRYTRWQEWLAMAKDETFSMDDITRLEHGNRAHGDSIHILVMDLHKELNQLAATLASEEIDGAHVWNLDGSDRDRVRSFMRGLHRTAPLKFDHPGLDTAATRDGHQLVLQNDIGTNDAHVLVIHIEDLRIVLTYSDLHERRFEFFRDSLSELGAVWSVVGPRVTSGLNEGAAYFVGTATFTCDNLDSLDRTLEELGSRIVFLIDWNRTRKRLQQFVSKPCAIDILNAVARAEVGHMGWLKAGGERLLFSAMQAAGDGVFRLGDRLDAVLSESGARQFLIDTMSLASRAVLNGQPIALIEDETRVLLTRYLQSWASEFDLASEHAAYCHELAMAVRDALAHGYNRKEEAKVTVRTKSWERRADDLVEQAREAAKLHPRWQHFAHLIELADNIADNLEEAAFVFGVIVEEHEGALKNGIRESMLELANSVLNATKDYVKALTVARTLAHATDLDASSAFLDATWRVVLAEKSCDEQLRTVRRLILRELSKAPEVILTTDLANRLEQASDALMIVSYALRDVVLAKTGAVS